MPPTFGRYELLKRLAGGGMGEVYLARQRGLAGFSKLLVIKTLLPHLCEDEEFIHMFQDEARITAQLIHPNICQPFEFDQVDSAYYIAMEYLRGEDLRRLWKAATLKGLQVPVPLICRIISDAASGLDFAHGLKDGNGEPYGIVHRDISPQNIIVTFEGGVKLIDFGVAKAQGRLTHTRTGALKGKYSYMSPEQVNGEQVDHRTDIFALGIVLHELLTAVRLFKADSDVSTIERVKSGPILAPSAINPTLPPGLDEIVLKALDRDPDKRYQTAQELRLALENYLMAERMPASSAHLAEFLKQVYKERLLLEARHGPLLGEAEPTSMPAPGLRPPSGSSLPRVTGEIPKTPSGGMPFPFDAPPPQPLPAQRASQEGTRNERTPSQPSQTNPGQEESKKSVIDLSMIETESGAGPFKRKRVRLIAAVGSALAIVVLSVALLRPKAEPAPAPAAITSTLRVVTEPPGATVTIDGQEAPGGVRAVPRGKSVQVQASLKGYLNTARLVQVAEADQLLRLSLEAETISLLVKSEPEGAQVVDGARIIGTTPFNWPARRERHLLTFRLAGHHDLEQQVEVNGAQNELFVRLKKVDGPRPAAQRKTEPTPDESIKLER